jgi:PAS domain S-box-containing protein
MPRIGRSGRKAPDALAALRESERLYRGLVEASSDLIWACDLTGRFTFTNEAARLMLGYEPGELSGMRFTELQPPDYAESDTAAFSRMLAGEPVFGLETVRLRKDGTRVLLNVNALPLRDESGRVVGIMGTARDVTEQRRSERAYRERERLYRDIARNFPNGAVLLFDRDLRFTLAEGQGLSNLGFARGDLEGKVLHEVVPPASAAVLEPAYRAALEGRSNIIEAPFRDRFYTVQCTPVRDEHGSIVGGMVVAQDVSQQKRGERIRIAFSELGRGLSAARTPEEAARIIVAAAQDLIGWECCSLDLILPERGTVQAVLSMDSFDGPPVDVPHAYEEGPPGGMTLKVLREGAQIILRDERAPSAPEGLVAFGSERPSASLLFVPIRHGDRTAGILSIQSYQPNAYTDADLAILQALADHCGGAFERLRVEEALRESQAQLARAEALSLVMTVHLGLDGRWLKVPGTLCSLLGYTEEELLGLRERDVSHPDDVEHGLRQQARLIRGDARSYDLEKRYLRRDGTYAWTYLNCSIVQDDAGRPLYFLGYLRDITERKSLEDQLRQAQKMEAVGQLAGGIAHDFNNLLTAILGNAELLQAEMGPRDPQRLDVQEISRAAHRAATLTRQLLAFSRKQVLQPRIVTLNAVVTDLSAMLRRIIGEDIELRLELDHGLGQVLADAGQLEQVITNLAVNARDAMPRGGRLTIRTANVAAEDVAASDPEAPPLLGPLVAVSVADTGTGMDERTQARLFEPFFTTKELGRGTGLGLATVYGIVRQSGGHIRVRTRLHHGTTFTVYLPRVEGDPGPDGETGAADAMPPGTETVLVVEDEEAVRALARRVLISRGYRVLEAGSAADALALVGEFDRIDLLITDVVMPDMGGPALAEQLVRNRPDLRVLYISGYAEEAIQRHGILPAGGMLLEKPFTADQLSRQVRESLSPGED